MSDVLHVPLSLEKFTYPTRGGHVNVAILRDLYGKEVARWSGAEVTSGVPEAFLALANGSTYPTAAEYEAVCRARDEWQRKAEAAEKDAAGWKREWEMYRNAWARELKEVFYKSHDIDSLVLTTKHLRDNYETWKRYVRETNDERQREALKEWLCEKSEPANRMDISDRLAKTYIGPRI